MPKYIAKFGELYCEWSTVVDAPISYLVPLDEFRAYYRAQYGGNGMKDLPDRLARVEMYGTSCLHGQTAADLFSCNRAGANESELRTVAELIAAYGPSAEPPHG